MLADEQLSPERIAILRCMTPEQKLKAAERMYWEARRSKEDELRNLNPNWSEQEIHNEAKRIFLNEAMKES
jgi:hypothetical protein